MNDKDPPHQKSFPLAGNKRILQLRMNCTGELLELSALYFLLACDIKKITTIYI